MIRIEVIAKRLQAAEDLAELLSGDDRIEVVRARVQGAGSFHTSVMADVVVALDAAVEAFPGDGPPTVLLSDKPLKVGSAAVHASLPVDSSPAEIAAAIVASANGLYVLTPEQFRTSRAGMPSGVSDSGISPEKLTPRELQVLAMMADGLANKEIAAALSISGNTVKFHVAQVLAKLGVASRTEAVRTGIRRGYVAI